MQCPYLFLIVLGLLLLPNLASANAERMTIYIP